MTLPLPSPGALQVIIMMIPSGEHSDDNWHYENCRFYVLCSWSSEHQGYDCNTLPPAPISWKWISFVWPCFKYASSDDRQCITLGQLLWTMDQFLVTNKSQVCELCISMFRNIWYWVNQFNAHKPDCATIGPVSTQSCKPDPTPFWHVMARLRGCDILCLELSDHHFSSAEFPDIVIALFRNKKALYFKWLMWYNSWL